MIKNVLFDFGGVLYDIDYEGSMRHLAALSAKPELLRDMPLDKFYDVPEQFEMGKISASEFRNFLREVFHIEKNDEEIDRAWVSMLIGLKPDAVNVVREFKQYFNVSLLSNTNIIHYDAFKTECSGLLGLFDGAFMSFDTGLRKPMQEIYEYVCNKVSYVPEETIFIDDSERNLPGAKAAGLHTLLFGRNGSLSGLLHSIRKIAQNLAI